MNEKLIAQPEPHQPEYHTDIPVGEILRRARVHYNQSLMEVESNLRIRSTQIQAIEEGDFAKMPGRVYAIGFVRSYSEYLGLDGDKMVGLFKAQYNAFGNRPALSFPSTMAESKLPNPYVIMGALVGGILFIAFWSLFMLPDHQREPIPVVPEQLTQSTLPVIELTENVVSDATTPEQQPVVLEPVTPSIQVELVISENSWTDIRNAKGDIILRQILKPGEKYAVPAGEEGKGLIMSTGNAGGITVFIDGKKIGVLGQGAQVKRKIPLEAALLKEYLSKL